ncbi:hypothetical protein [Amycolatopsis nigrescens]|uniref:hypothetical protein n=1 Tax=Amycolatopsis nigrescens TaxID=381445 RepID=UPI000688ACE0|nr:hypothetical protein [Amycolatopsis nigrescens]
MFTGIHLTTASTRVPDQRQGEWHGLLIEQHGLITNRQATALGITPQTIRSNVSALRWQPVMHGVYATFTGPLPRETRLMAALLYAGAPAVLSHRTAAEEWGMLPIDDGQPLHVTVPYNCSAVSRLPLVAVHRSRAFHHIATVDTPLPRTSRADTIIDVAVQEDTGSQVRTRFIALAGSAPVSMVALARQVELRPPHRFRTAVWEALQLMQGGALSALEAEYALHVESAHGLPAPQRQTPVSVNGRTLWEDITYDNVGVPLTTRLDGRETHATPGVAFRDRERDNAAELADRSRLVYGWADVTTAPCQVAAQVLTVLHRAGWKGAAHPCSTPFCLVSGRE